MKTSELFEQENEFANAALVYFELDSTEFEDDDALQIAQEVAKRVNGEVWNVNWPYGPDLEREGGVIEFVIKVPQNPDDLSGPFEKVQQALRRLARGKMKFPVPSVY